MLYPMLLICYHQLHPLFEDVTIDWGVDEDCSLNIFEMTLSTNELRNNLLAWNFLFLEGFKLMRKYQMSSSMVEKTWFYVSYSWIPYW
jgi:hypothetical protein